MKWTFNPPFGLDHGAIWKRLIQCIWKVLSFILDVQHPNEQGLHTILWEVEAIINTRPITKTFIDLHDILVPKDWTIFTIRRFPARGRIFLTMIEESSVFVWPVLEKMGSRILAFASKECQRWFRVNHNINNGDIVLIMDGTAPYNSWIIVKVGAFPCTQYVGNLRDWE